MTPSDTWMNRLKPWLAVSLGVAIVEDCAYAFNPSTAALWMTVAAILYAGMFFFAILSLHWRALWLLLGLPLVLLPFAVAIVASGRI